jgi:hypothetical protein
MASFVEGGFAFFGAFSALFGAGGSGLLLFAVSGGW